MNPVNFWQPRPLSLRASSFPFRLESIPVALHLVCIPDTVAALFSEEGEWTAWRTRKKLFVPEVAFPEGFSESEKARFHGFAAAKRQMEWLCGRMAVKKLVQAFLCPDRPMASIGVENTEKGVPFLPDFPGYALSISHGGDYAVAGIVLEKGGTLGLDLEPDRKRDTEALRRMAFSEEEWAFLSGKPEREILRHWTLKEAGLKLVGQGFHLPLKKLEILPEGMRVHGKDVSGVSCWTADIEGGHLLSLLYGKDELTGFQLYSASVKI
ncbi:4'-phosphopantetheinyl transferase family protein [Desulfobotulus mexicanus]|uniref:4'-phosphopantetheinyl transferase superfamily protein n=1 Tax=Desulfobotulus mexicanus TaxID=2586642 RepID=A0A5Q4VFL4_9BACT|nr:4'-phosphopantetheinyl transferase superfamily protein [Desulfobotulus mexicanus]TYT75167.1 4'-phosphopantetheinyl transferase superfamily protein [Desulfobotulus mexicanus]